MTELPDNQNYLDFFITVKERIRKSQYDALRAVNKELIQLYHDIGKLIIEKQDKLGWGNLLLKNFRKIYAKNILEYKAFLLAIFGICECSMLKFNQI